MSDDSAERPRVELRQLVARVSAAYFSNNHVGAAEIPQVMGQIASSLAEMDAAAAPAAPAPAPAKLTRAQIRRSITPDALISFEDGRPYRSLARHLAARGLTPEDYRRKWGLADDYPMASESYRAERAELARRHGFGRRPRRRR